MFAIKLCANAPDRELVTVIRLQATEDYGTEDICTKIFATQFNNESGW